MGWVIAVVLSASGIAGAAQSYELVGSVEPAGRARLALHGAVTPFGRSAIADPRGRFRFRKLPAGTYSLGAFTRSRGEARQTIEVGPGTADARRRVTVRLQLKETEASRDALRRRNLVSAAQLAMPDKAMREWQSAQACLARQDSACAARHLEKAVEIAPRFSTGWNSLGTIYYQTRRFTLAEQMFRRSLAEDPTAYEPLVNLGGALVTLNKLDEAMDYNLRAVLARPGDALANSQLGMTYMALGKLDLACKYLEVARSLDPAHFSHPQLLLAEIHFQQKQPAAAAEDLEDFLKHHPDAPNAASLRSVIAKLRE